MAVKSKTVYVCTECGAESPKWAGKCPSCGQWDTLTEFKIETSEKASKTAKEAGMNLQSIYFGGGTPAILDAFQINDLLECVYKNFDVTDKCEVTFEAGRPECITKDKLRAMLQYGVNRISVNTQSTNDSILKAIGRNHTYEDLKNLINSEHNLGRPDVAKLLVKNGYAKNVQQAFVKYLNDVKSKLGDRVKGIPYEECIDLIINSGGIPVLAHPKTLKLDDNELRELVKHMKSIGLNGIEVYHSIHNEEERNNYLNMANDFDLLISGGTDYHGPINKPNIKLGSGDNGNVKIKKLTLLDELNRRKDATN